MAVFQEFFSVCIQVTFHKLVTQLSRELNSVTGVPLLDRADSHGINLNSLQKCLTSNLCSTKDIVSITLRRVGSPSQGSKYSVYSYCMLVLRTAGDFCFHLQNKLRLGIRKIVLLS